MTDDDMPLYEQEVSELTELLRTEWDDLRVALTSGGLVLDGYLLAAYVEDEEDGSEHGVLVRAADDVIRFIVNNTVVTTERVTLATVRTESPQ